MGQEPLRILDSIARDRKIDRETLIQDIEVAIMAAARRHFNTLDTDEFRCVMDRFSGDIRLWRRIPTEVDPETGESTGETEEIEIDPTVLGRISAQTFRQVMIQRFREDERAALYEEFSKRVGEMVTGTAQRYEGGALVIQVDRAEGFMPRSEQIPGEAFQPGDRVRCQILDVRDQGNQVKIVLSRGHPDFIRRLFEVEVPEVSERIIEIKAMAREAGFRTKLAVSSIDSKVDAVGACVGVRGSRIKNIVDELGGEKIDIVRWNDSSQILIQNSLKPAEVKDVSLCFELGRATVVVEEDQLSLAIGKRGQNVRLAARLTGWDIDILTPVEYAKGLEVLVETLRQVESLSEEQLDRLAALGIVSVFDVEEVGMEVLQEELAVTEDEANQMLELAAAKAKIVAEQQQKEKEEEKKRREEEQQLAQSVLHGDGTDAATDGDGESSVQVDASSASRAAEILGFTSASDDSDQKSSGDETTEESGNEEQPMTTSIAQESDSDEK